jgi:hypothetical protein
MFLGECQPMLIDESCCNHSFKLIAKVGMTKDNQIKRNDKLFHDLNTLSERGKIYHFQISSHFES